MGNSQQRVKKLRQAIGGNDRRALERLVEKGIDINMAIDDIGNTPLTLAIQLNQCDTVRYLVTANCDVERRSRLQFSALEIVLLNLAHTENSAYLEILRVLLQAGAESVSDAVMETVFPMIQHNRELVVKLSRTVAQYAQMPHDITGTLSHVIVQHNQPECFWALLESGADLRDIWPNSCDQRYFLPSSDLSEGPINTYFTTICCTRNIEFAQIYIQAANSINVLKSIIYFILVYPITSASKIKELLKALVMAGYKLSDFLLIHLAREDKDMVTWYNDFHSAPLSLKHLSRLCIRKNLQTNVIYGVNKLPLPLPMMQYIRLEDIIDPRDRTRQWEKRTPRSRRAKKRL